MRGYENLNCLIFWLFQYKSCSVLIFLQNLLRFMNSSVDMDLFVSAGRFEKFWHGPPKSNLPFWALNQHIFSNCRIWVSGQTHIQYRFIEFRSEKREASELFKERARARAHAALSFATYPSRLSHTCTCFFSLQIITEKIELESLENAEIRFLSSWSFIYLFACSGTRLIHIYLWFMQIWLLFWNLVDFDIYAV